MECPENHTFAPQNLNFEKTFENTSVKLDWNFICNPDETKYKFSKDSFELCSGDLTIDTLKGSPVFIGIRQSEFNETCKVACQLKNPGEAGLTAYLDPNHHYDVYLEQRGNDIYAVLKVTIGPASCIKKEVLLKSSKAVLKISASPYGYDFFADEVHLGAADTKYLSSEVAGGFTGVFWGLYAQNGASAKFTDFKAEHKE